MATSETPVAIIMGSRSDWPTMKLAADRLDQLGVAWDAKVVSAHRTPQRLVEFATGAKAAGYKVIIAGAGGAAHLPGMAASMTELPVLGVPVQSKALKGMDSLLSIVQMPAGVPVATLAIGEAGAANAGIATGLDQGDAEHDRDDQWADTGKEDVNGHRDCHSDRTQKQPGGIFFQCVGAAAGCYGIYLLYLR